MGSDLQRHLIRFPCRISIHAPRVGSDGRELWRELENLKISIHAPRVGSDARVIYCYSLYKIFQSTLPVWGATVCTPRKVQHQNDFNPRSPCGERPQIKIVVRFFATFQSTLPVWGATVKSLQAYESNGISIHAPRVGSDMVALERAGVPVISIHAPRVGSDPQLWYTIIKERISIHAPRVGSD